MGEPPPMATIPSHSRPGWTQGYDALQQAGRCETAVADDQWPPQAQPGERIGQRAHRARLELDGGEIENAAHDDPSAFSVRQGGINSVRRASTRINCTIRQSASQHARNSSRRARKLKQTLNYPLRLPFQDDS
jgi:hypothetical protein